jgi:hypothetical protein
MPFTGEPMINKPMIVVAVVVVAGEDVVQVGGAFLLGSGAETSAEGFAERFRNCRRGEEAVEQCAQVEAGASGDDREHFVPFSTRSARVCGWV